MKIKFLLIFFLCLLIFEIKSQSIRDCYNIPCDSCLFKLNSDRYYVYYTSYPNIFCTLKEYFDVSISFNEEDKKERILISFTEKDDGEIGFESLYFYDVDAEHYCFAPDFYNPDILNEEERKILVKELKKIKFNVRDTYDSLTELMRLSTLKYRSGFTFPVKLKRKE